MSDGGGGESISWNKTSLPAKVFIILMFVFVGSVNLIVWGYIFLSAFRRTSIPRPHWPTPVTTPADAVTATAAVGVTTTPEVTASSPNVKFSTEVLVSQPTSSHSMSADRGKSNLECSVCLMEFEEGAEERFLPCLHKFHAECIDMWIHSHSTCPLCRTIVEVEIV